MKTRYLKTAQEDIQTAARLLQEGELVAIPTETVYGLAANALDAQAVGSIFTAKGRPQDNPLIVHIAQMETLEQVVREVPPAAQKLMNRFWPGPLTVVLKRHEQIPSVVSCGLDTVAVRMPSHQTACAIIKAAGVPLAAPSANLSGSPSPTTVQHVLADFDGAISAVVDGGASEVGLESTVVSFTGEIPVLLRPGAITLEQLRDVLGEVAVSQAVTGQMDSKDKISAPGMKYRHYSPNTPLVLVRGGDFCTFVNARKEMQVGAVCFEEDASKLAVPHFVLGCADDEEEQARRLFSILRQVDGQGFTKVYVHCPGTDGIGLAVFNRLQKAAGYRVVDLDYCPFVVGITGPTGAGKSVVSRAFSDCGYAVADADAIAKRVIECCMNRLVAFFGNDIIKADGSLDRAALAKLAFADPEKLKFLNGTTHPVIRMEMEECLLASHSGYAAIDAPLLFESGADCMCHKTVCVLAGKSVRLGRIMKRDGITEAAALQRMDAQNGDAYYQQRADYELKGDDTTESLYEQAKKVAMELRGEE